MKDRNSLLELIDEESRTLANYADTYGLSSEDTIVQSQKLDELILQYQLLHCEGDQK
ncbi:hypothetical protein JOC85_001009 [Bacillus mesophilus]|uniref:Aspartyl-phosphate phosphatase Spo0E family protein n=1 Tax=Bacillus mesophilus TaxID=1808955 RepID=A0A6M0Q626_9BACI|nr:aspartyl-phosphate phosphatase Spo0E family protein [Bacillus mesophilus]MBM7660242.1 hypothetical protein [Bacillus mesophilus]NEY70960.1 aspartyl-phosphate phosphatase Spo0E family protein [Bacillus mesophilus]